MFTDQSNGGVEYVDYISTEEVKTPTHEWISSPGALGNEEYTFIAITPRSTLTLSDSTC